MIYRFIRDHWQEFAVAVMCRVLGISRCGGMKNWHAKWRKLQQLSKLAAGEMIGVE